MKFLNTIEEQNAVKHAPVGKSLTKPNDTISVKDILNNYASGAYVGYAKDGQYEENVNFDSIRIEDYKDIAELETACANHADVLKAYKRALEIKQVQPTKDELVDENKNKVEIHLHNYKDEVKATN